MSSLIRYQSIALLLKLMGATAATRHVYRQLGNRLGERRRQTAGSHFREYLRRGTWFIEQFRAQGLPLATPMRALELGTGWLHFYAVFLRLFYQVEVTLFDVWDCRQFEALRNMVSNVPANLPEWMPLSDAEAAQVRAWAEVITAQTCFDDVYRLLGFDYVVDAQGELGAFRDGQFDLVFSFDVLEHVNAAALPHSIASYCRVLRPGGVSIHQIGLDDHLALYDRRASHRQYLAYPDWEWKLRFENRLQYFNRVPYSRFRELFEACGMEEVHASATYEHAAVEDLRIASSFRAWSVEDLEATRAYLVYRKPPVE
jgi:SAM-dependent methyltransferase